MKRFAVLATLAIALVAVAGCATMNTGYHLDPTAPFDHYVTYKWGPPDNLPVGDPRLDNNPFFIDYLQGAVEKNLAGKGYVYDAIDPDLLIHYHASVNQKLDVYGTDKNYGYCTGNCEPQVVEYELGTLMLDVVDARTSKVVWRGWAQDAMNGIIDNQDRLEQKTEEGVTRMMALMPATAALERSRIITP
jgi:hypothetical protein